MVRKRNPFGLEMPDLSGDMNMQNLFGETPRRIVRRQPRPYPQPYSYPRPRIVYAPRQRVRYVRARRIQPKALIGPEQRKKIVAGARFAYAGTKASISFARKKYGEYKEAKREKWQFEKKQPAKTSFLSKLKEKVAPKKSIYK
jgi:hypothetical protein